MSALDIPSLKELIKGNKEVEAILPMAVKRIQSGETKIVAVSGKKGSGKDSISEALAKKTGKTYLITSFAKALKNTAQELFDRTIYLHAEHGYTDDMIVNDLIQRNQLEEVPYITQSMHSLVQGILEDHANGIVPNSWKRSPGAWRGLQLWGTEIRRRQDDLYWVKKTVAEMLQECLTKDYVFVADARFFNEIKAMETLGATTIRMNVSPEVQKVRLTSRDGSSPSPEALSHPSETELDNYEFQYSINNDGDGTIDDHASHLLTKIT